jgi:hypothetical protein
LHKADTGDVASLKSGAEIGDCGLYDIQDTLSKPWSTFTVFTPISAIS